MCTPKLREFKLGTGHSRSLQNGEIPTSDILTRRLNSPVERDTYAEILRKHNDLIKRGEYPGSGHILGRRQSDIAITSPTSLSLAEGENTNGILFGDHPTISSAAPLDEDGQDISTYIPPNLSNL